MILRMVVFTLSLLWISSTLAQEGMIIVDCETDGNGLFTYNISGTNDVWYWSMSGSDRIDMQSYSVEWASAPDGWVTTVADDGVVTWQYTNGIWVVNDVPLVLQIKSSISAWTNYVAGGSDYYPPGVTYGCAWNGPFNYGGYTSFEHIGPIRVPRFKGMTASNSQLNFAIENIQGNTCFLEKATDLANPDWQPFACFSVTSAYTNYVHALPSNTNECAFFRMRFE